MTDEELAALQAQLRAVEARMTATEARFAAVKAQMKAQSDDSLPLIGDDGMLIIVEVARGQDLPDE